MKTLYLTGLALIALGLGGCANVRTVAPAALNITSSPVDLGPAAIANPSKRGQACAENYLGWIAIGDASIDTAKRNGGISKVASVEQSVIRGLGYYARYCTIVSGE